VGELLSCEAVLADGSSVLSATAGVRKYLEANWIISERNGAEIVKYTSKGAFYVIHAIRMHVT